MKYHSENLHGKASLGGGNPLLFMRDSINPYRFALATVIDRLRWDLRWESWRSRRRLRNIHQTRRGKAVIVCNGPSLNQTPLSNLTGIFSFGLNKINLLFGRHAFRPSAIVAVNPYVIQQNRDFFNETDIPLYIDSLGIRHIQRRENVTFVKNSPEPRLARDCSWGVHQGFTVTCVALQIAYHMGFEDVALVGCDHSFQGAGQSNEITRADGRDVNHFDPNYFASGQQWQLPDLLGSEYFYKFAREMFDFDGRRIVNCTLGGRLELFPRMPLNEWINSTYVT